MGAISHCMAPGRDQGEVEEFDRRRADGEIEDAHDQLHWADGDGNRASDETVNGMLRLLRSRAEWRKSNIPLCDLSEEAYEKVGLPPLYVLLSCRLI